MLSKLCLQCMLVPIGVPDGQPHLPVSVDGQAHLPVSVAVCRRVGGGFGGKASRPMIPAAACAVAAHKLGKQVRLSYNRNTDFRQNGGAHMTDLVSYSSQSRFTRCKFLYAISSVRTCFGLNSSPGYVLHFLHSMECTTALYRRVTKSNTE